ncbi:MAG: EF-P beta-lysylation protein EpmB [Nevskiaceae bacterium]|nr:MAG: EF-P beta-lysylation protein EpmB [Nevskiaceae bacterium]TBR73127.1 MAG: EF-P beta-lysylation protein EpmB [Nevskiaceae bacterium]
MDIAPPSATDGFINSPAELLRELQLDPALPELDAARRREFPLHVPRSFVRRMRCGDPRDPLFLQVWPAAAEAMETAGFSLDAVGELGQREAGGVIRKYHGRALIVTTGACAVNCRYCFRRHFPYAQSAADGHDWHTTLDTLAADPSISEAILSGGDPLSLSNARLAALVHGLDAIPHLKRLRIHTRVPVVQPSRVDAGCIGWLTGGRLQRIVVVHANHANEIDADVAAACQRLRGTGALLLNQSVLLRGVNDSATALATLSYRLCEVGILPYYLHMLDRVQGAAHFEVQELEATRLMKELVAELPGYLVPRLVREISGRLAKTRVQWSD